MVAEPEAAVTAALRAGDQTAFAELVRTWSPVLVRTATDLSGDRAVAEAMVRATWLQLPIALGNYRPPPGLYGWVCGLLLAEVGVQDGRDGAAYGEACSAATVERSRFLPPSHQQWPGHWEHPPGAWPAAVDDPVAAHALDVALSGALDQLPTAQRVVVGLRDVAGCELADIAHIVRQPPAQVRNLLHHGRANLRLRLELHFADMQAV